MALLLVTTLLAVPTIWLVTRDDEAPAGGTPSDLPVVEPFDPIGDVPSMFGADGTPAPTPSTPAVVVGVEDTQLLVRARATYTKKSDEVASRRCALDGVESGQEVTIVNVANGRSTECRTTGAVRDDGLLVLHAGDFQNIASLVDAPIHVEIRR